MEVTKERKMVIETQILSEEEFNAGKTAGGYSAWSEEIVADVKDAMNSNKSKSVGFSIKDLLTGYIGSVDKPCSKQARLLVKQVYLELTGDDKMPRKTLKVDNTKGLIKIKVFD